MMGTRSGTNLSISPSRSMVVDSFCSKSNPSFATSVKYSVLSLATKLSIFLKEIRSVAPL